MYEDENTQLAVLIRAVNNEEDLTCYLDGGDVMIYDENGVMIYSESEHVFIEDVCNILGIEMDYV